jgi:chromosome segregation ATPase
MMCVCVTENVHLQTTAADPAEGMAISLPEDKIKYLEGKIQSLQMQLAFQSQTTASTSSELETVKQELHHTDEKYNDETERTMELTRDMTRQYKGMQEDLLHKINERERTIQELTDSLHHERMEREIDKKEMDQVLSEKGEYIDQLKDKMEDLCLSFMDMIKNANAQMQRRIEIQGASYNKDIIPIQQRMEEFNLFKESTFEY